jgi:hypothetical protein
MATDHGGLAPLPGSCTDSRVLDFEHVVSVVHNRDRQWISGGGPRALAGAAHNAHGRICLDRLQSPSQRHAPKIIRCPMKHRPEYRYLELHSPSRDICYMHHLRVSSAMSKRVETPIGQWGPVQFRPRIFTPKTRPVGWKCVEGSRGPALRGQGVPSNVGDHPLTPDGQQSKGRCPAAKSQG